MWCTFKHLNHHLQNNQVEKLQVGTKARAKNLQKLLFLRIFKFKRGVGKTREAESKIDPCQPVNLSN